MKEWLANTDVNTIDSGNIVSYGCYNCGKNFLDCKYLKEKGEYFYRFVTKRRYKVMQNVNCQSENVIYFVICKNVRSREYEKQLDSQMANYRSCIKNKKNIF